MDQELVDAIAHAPRVSTHQIEALFMAAILKLWRHIRNPTLSIDDAYLLKEQSAKFHPDQFWNDGALGFSLKRSSQQQQQEEEQQ